MARAHVIAMIRELDFHRVVVETMRSDGVGATTAYERKLVDEIRELQASYEDLFRAVLEAGMAQGSLRAQNVSVAMHSVLMLLNAPVYWYKPRPGETASDIAAIADQVADMALGAVRA